MLARAMSNPLFKTFLAILGGEVALPLRSFLLQIRAKLRRPRRSRPIDSSESFFTMLKVCRESARARLLSRQRALFARVYKGPAKKEQVCFACNGGYSAGAPDDEVNAP